MSSRRRGWRWGDLSLARRMLLVATIPILALVGASAAFFEVSRIQHAAQQDLADAQQVRSDLADSLRLVIDLETGARGYVLTRDADYLGPTTTASAQLPGTRISLEASLDDAAGEPGALEHLWRLIDDRVRRSRDLVEVADDTEGAPSDAQVLRALEAGRHSTDAIRAEIGRLDAAVSDTVDDRQATVDSRYDRGRALVVVGLVVGVGGGMLLAAVLARTITRRLAVVGANVGHLERGEPFEPLPRSHDEIGDVDRGLRETARLLQDRQAALERSEAFLDSVIEHLPAMVFVKDAQELRFTRFNAAGEAMIGHRREALLGRSDFDLFPAEQAEQFTAMDRRTLEEGHLVDIPEEEILTASGELRILHSRKIPILDADGRPAYLLGISQDITERKVVEAEIRQAREDAQLANTAKSDFLSRMSHELRTPLNSVIGFSQLLEGEALTAAQAESVTQIARAGRHLLGLINEVLDLTRIETGQLPVSLEPVRLSDVTAEALALMRPIAGARGVVLPAGVPAVCEAHVHADRQRLKQVLLNLLSNAIKYNRSNGRVTLACTAEDGRLRVTVEDDGPGILPAQLELLFAPFERLGAEATGQEGTGLGLALSRRLMEVMGGEIGVDPPDDRGARFWFELPLADAPAATELVAQTPTITAVAATSGTILYIEDNLANVRLVQALLERRPGVRLEVAMQGGVGVELAIHNRPDLILLDLNLPDRSGEDVLAELRAEPATRNIPVVVLSADATPGQVARLRALGASDYLTKPFDLPRFFEVVDLLAARADPTDGSSTAPGLPPAPAMDHLDARVIADLRQLDADSGKVHELVEVFATEIGRRLTELEPAVVAGELEAVGSLAHSIKGSVGTFGARRAAALAEDLRVLLAAGGPALTDDLLRVSRELQAEARAALVELHAVFPPPP